MRLKKYISGGLEFLIYLAGFVRYSLELEVDEGEDKKTSITRGPPSWILPEMPGKLAKNKKIREGQRTHATKVLASVNEVLTEYDGSRNAKDKITELSIALNEKW